MNGRDPFPEVKAVARDIDAFDRRLAELRRLARGTAFHQIPPEELRRYLELLREGLADLAADSLDLHRQVAYLATGSRRPVVGPLLLRRSLPRLVRRAAGRGWHLLRSARRHLLGATRPSAHADGDAAFAREWVLQPSFPVPALTVPVPDLPSRGSPTLEEQTLGAAGELVLGTGLDENGLPQSRPPFLFVSGSSSELLPATALELAVLELLLEDLLFVELQVEDVAGRVLVSDDAHGSEEGSFVVRSDLLGIDGDVDWKRLAQTARSERRWVVGKAIRLLAVDRPGVARRGAVRRVMLPADGPGAEAVEKWVDQSYFTCTGTPRRPLLATRPSHRLCPPELSWQAPVSLLVLPPITDHELQELLVSSLKMLAPKDRLAVALLGRQDQPRLFEASLRQVTPLVYPLGELPPAELQPARVDYLIRRFGDPQVVLAAGLAPSQWDSSSEDLVRGLREGMPSVRLKGLAVAGWKGVAGVDEVSVLGEEIPIAIDCSYYHGARWSNEERSRVRREVGAEDDQVLVVMATTLLADRRPEDLIAAAQRLRDDRRFRFVVVGDGPVGPIVDDMVRFFGLTNLCRLRSCSDRAALLAVADVVCSTSTREPAPLAILGAVALEKPVVVSPELPLAVLVAETGCGVVLDRAGDIDGLVSVFERLSSREQRAALGSARGRILEQHELSASAEALGQLLDLPLPSVGAEGS